MRVRIVSRTCKWQFYHYRIGYSSGLPPTEFHLWDVPASHMTRSQDNADIHILCVDILQKDWVSLASSARQNCFPNVQMAILPLSYRIFIWLAPNRVSSLGRTAGHTTRSQDNADIRILCVDILQKDWVSLARKWPI